ncbi:MAG: 50S ribosomal protein L6 [Candidatus Omnitrophota bacterium]
MSRKGKIPLSLPKEVKVAVNDGVVKIDGPKGSLSLNVPYRVKVEHKDNTLIVQRMGDDKQARSSHGTIRALLVNMIDGVIKGHRKDLEIQGIGFRAQVQGENLTLNLGFSHPVEYKIPKGVKITTPKPNQIVIEGTDRALVGNTAAEIRMMKKPEPYKGKGILYVGEVIRRKQGKTVTK